MRFARTGPHYVRRGCQFVQGAIPSQWRQRIEVRPSNPIRYIQLLTQGSSLPKHSSPASGPTTETTVQRTPATTTPLPSTSTAAPLSTSAASVPSNLTPFKQQRAFSSGSPGVTTWYTTSTAYDIVSPPRDIAPVIGDLYIHHNRLSDIFHIWLWGMDHQWKSVTDVEKVYHPAIDDRVLSMRANGTPNWITIASFTTIRGRKGKTKAFE